MEQDTEYHQKVCVTRRRCFICGEKKCALERENAKLREERDILAAKQAGN